jgi:hypothetical protein
MLAIYLSHASQKPGLNPTNRLWSYESFF